MADEQQEQQNTTGFQAPPKVSAFAAAAKANIDQQEAAEKLEFDKVAPIQQQRENEQVIPKLPEKKAAEEPKLGDEDMPPEIKSDKGKENWRTWKQKYSKLETDYSESQKKITEYEAKLKAEVDRLTGEMSRRVDPTEYEALKKERDEVQFKLRLKDVQEDPSWQSQIVKPMSDALELARQNCPRENRVQLERLLTQAPSDERTDAIEELVSGLSPLKQTNIARAMNEVDAVMKKRESLLADSKGLVQRYEEFQKRTAEESKLSARRELETEADAVLNAAIKSGFGIFKDSPENVTLARQYATSDLSARDRAHIAAWAVQGQKLTPLLQEAAAEIEKLKGQIAKMTATAPRGGSAAAAPQTGKPASFREAVLGYTDPA